MDSLKPLSIAEIIKETIKIFFKNGKLVPSITLLSLLIYSILYISNSISIKPLMSDLTFKLIKILLLNPTPSEHAFLILDIKQDLRVLTEIESIFLLIAKTFTLFVFISFILSSSIVYSKKDLPFKEFFSRVLRSWKEPLVTLFYTSLLNLGYMFLVLSVMFALVVILNDRLIVLFLSCIMIVVVPALIFYIYLAVIWTLGLVVSVLEENCYGIEALGKAANLVKGRKLQGFGLALLFNLITFGLIQGVGLINPKQSVAVQTIIGLLVTNSTILVEIFGLVAFTLFYYECKKIHGEEVVKLQGRLEYTKLPSTSFRGGPTWGRGGQTPLVFFVFPIYSLERPSVCMEY